MQIVSYQTEQEIESRIAFLKGQLAYSGILADLKQKGDIHVQNVFRFFGKWVSKDDPMRDAIKQIIFGTLYGKSVKTLAKDIKQDLAAAQAIVDKLFGEFDVGGAWLDDAATLIEKHAHVVSPIGRVRNVWRVYTGKRSYIGAARRRAQNSPIQGFASEIGASGAFLTLIECYKWLVRNGWDVEENMPQYNRAVHDSASYNVPYSFLIPFHHIRQHVATVGVAEWYKEKFGVEFTSAPEIEMEVFASEDKAKKWTYEIPNLLTNVHSALQEQVALGQLPAKKLDSTWESVIQPWKDKDMRALLQSEYPILQVHGLESNIKASLKAFKVPVQEEAKEKK